MKSIPAGTMIAKYMPVSDHGDRLGWVLDIIQMRRIFVPPLSILNDPFEKLLFKELEGNASSQEKRLKEFQQLALNNVCSFSKKGHSKVLMWSHYANNWNGIRLNFKAASKNKVFNVEYFDVMKSVLKSSTHLDVLRKLKPWKYEKECRHISLKSGFVDLDEIGLDLIHVDIGFRVNGTIAGVIADVCERENLSYVAIDHILDVVR